MVLKAIVISLLLVSKATYGGEIYTPEGMQAWIQTTMPHIQGGSILSQDPVEGFNKKPMQMAQDLRKGIQDFLNQPKPHAVAPGAFRDHMKKTEKLLDQMITIGERFSACQGLKDQRELAGRVLGATQAVTQYCLENAPQVLDDQYFANLKNLENAATTGEYTLLQDQLSEEALKEITETLALSLYTFSPETTAESVARSLCQGETTAQNTSVWGAVAGWAKKLTKITQKAARCPDNGMEEKIKKYAAAKLAEFKNDGRSQYNLKNDEKKSELGKKLNAKVQSINVAVMELNHAIKSVAGAGEPASEDNQRKLNAAFENYEKTYLNLADGFPDILLLTDTLRKKMGDLREQRERIEKNALSGKFNEDKDLYKIHRTVNQNDIEKALEEYQQGLLQRSANIVAQLSDKEGQDSDALDKREKDLKELIKTNPFTAGQFLASNPQYSTIYCKLISQIHRDDKTRDNWRWAAIVPGAMLGIGFMGGFAATAITGATIGPGFSATLAGVGVGAGLFEAAEASKRYLFLQRERAMTKGQLFSNLANLTGNQGLDSQVGKEARKSLEDYNRATEELDEAIFDLSLSGLAGLDVLDLVGSGRRFAAARRAKLGAATTGDRQLLQVGSALTSSGVGSRLAASNSTIANGLLATTQNQRNTTQFLKGIAENRNKVELYNKLGREIGPSRFNKLIGSLAQTAETQSGQKLVQSLEADLVKNIDRQDFDFNASMARALSKNEKFNGAVPHVDNLAKHLNDEGVAQLETIHIAEEAIASTLLSSDAKKLRSLRKDLSNLNTEREATLARIADKSNVGEDLKRLKTQLGTFDANIAKVEREIKQVKKAVNQVEVLPRSESFPNLKVSSLEKANIQVDPKYSKFFDPANEAHFIENDEARDLFFKVVQAKRNRKLEELGIGVDYAKLKPSQLEDLRYIDEQVSDEVAQALSSCRKS